MYKHLDLYHHRPHGQPIAAVCFNFRLIDIYFKRVDRVPEGLAGCGTFPHKVWRLLMKYDH